MSDLRTGKWICEQKGIPTQKLITAINSGIITVYSNENGQKIPPSSQCIKKFLFPDKLYFSLTPGKYSEYVAMNKGDINNFIIHLYSIEEYSNNNLLINGNIHNPDLNRIGHESLSIRGFHRLHEFCHDNENYLLFFQSKCDLSNSNNIYKYHKYLYPASEIIFEPKYEGRFTFRLLELDSYNQALVPREVHFSIKLIKNEDDSKLVLEDYKDNDISLYDKGLPCIKCYASPLRNKKERENFFSESYRKCRRYFHQYKLDYFKPDDKEFKNPLKLRTDFFIFDYKEYCQQTYLQENEESRSNFYQYIESLFFDINELENIFIDDFEEEKMLADPLGYTKLKCISLLKKYKGFDEQNIIYAYLTSLLSDLQYAQLNDSFFPLEKDHDSNVKTSRFSRYIDRFAIIASENDFPYIAANQLRKLTSLKVLEEIKKSIRKQFADIRAKKKERAKQ